MYPVLWMQTLLYMWVCQSFACRPPRKLALKFVEASPIVPHPKGFVGYPPRPALEWCESWTTDENVCLGKLARKLEVNSLGMTSEPEIVDRRDVVMVLDFDCVLENEVAYLGMIPGSPTR